MSYIGAEELVYNNDKENGIYTGGFSVKSLMMKGGMTPIITINEPQNGGTEKVSDLFSNLAVPSWLLSQNHLTGGGNISIKQKYNDEIIDDDDETNNNEIIDDDLHDKLLELVKEHDIKNKSNKNNKKSTRKQEKNKINNKTNNSSTRKIRNKK